MVADLESGWQSLVTIHRLVMHHIPVHIQLRSPKPFLVYAWSTDHPYIDQTTTCIPHPPPTSSMIYAWFIDHPSIHPILIGEIS